MFGTFVMGSQIGEHERKIYGILDVLGDFGGVQQVLETVAAILMGPIAAHAFLSKAISKLYLARTDDAALFGKKKSVKSESKNAMMNIL
jgi:hypothetical protein